MTAVRDPGLAVILAASDAERAAKQALADAHGGAAIAEAHLAWLTACRNLAIMVDAYRSNIVAADEAAQEMQALRAREREEA